MRQERELTRRVREATLQVLGQYSGRLGVRQIWYRLISPPFQLLPQTDNSYKGFDRLMVRWRETGAISPRRISDRSTYPTGGEYGHDSVRSFLEDLLDQASAEKFVRNRWTSQEVVPIIYIEKDTLTDTIEDAIQGLGIVIYPTKGVTSFTKLWELARRRRVHILHMTDHDATGVFMGQDFRDRLTQYGGRSLKVTRIALTIDQVNRFKLPPNPTHRKDSRSPAYIEKFGDRAWELDAVPPDELGKIARRAIEKFIDKDSWKAVDETEAQDRVELEPKLEPVRDLIRKLAEEEP